MAEELPSLKPCPFCGGKPTVCEVPEYENGMYVDHFHIVCLGCHADVMHAGLGGKSKDYPATVHLWNTRVGRQRKSPADKRLYMREYMRHYRAKKLSQSSSTGRAPAL